MFTRYWFFKLTSVRDDKICGHWRVLRLRVWKNLFPQVDRIIKEIESEGYSNVAIEEIHKL